LELTSVGEAIATRTIRDQQSGEPWVVKIGLPQRFPGSTDFYCPVQITSISKEDGTVLYSAGIDSVQALQLAMKLLGGILLRLNEQSGGHLRWEGDENGGLGFPIPV
jgi:hypothetical protein